MFTNVQTKEEARIIKDAIRILIDGYNLTKGFKYSTLVQDLQNSEVGKYIDHIVFKGLNGTWNQEIRPINKKEFNQIPEFFNIPLKTLEEKIKIYNREISEENPIL